MPCGSRSGCRTSCPAAVFFCPAEYIIKLDINKLEIRINIGNTDKNNGNFILFIGKSIEITDIMYYNYRCK
jgi:hypothetical protein